MKMTIVLFVAATILQFTSTQSTEVSYNFFRDVTYIIKHQAGMSPDETMNTICKDDVENGAWLSHVTANPISSNPGDTVAAVAISWNPHQNEEESYVVMVSRNEEIAATIMSQTTSGDVIVENLAFDTHYQAFVCLADSVRNLSSKKVLFQAQCGMCITNFQTTSEEEAGSSKTNVNFTTEQGISEDQAPETPTSEAVPVYGIIILVIAPFVIFLVGMVTGLIILHQKFSKRNQNTIIKWRLASNSSQFNITGKPGTNMLTGDLLRSKLPKNMFISTHDLTVTKVIGHGEYGIIYRASLRTKKTKYPKSVAIKTLKGIFTTVSDIERATTEILKMSQFNHPNVMTLIGVCVAPSEQSSSSIGPSIVMPFMANGSLLDYLRKEAGNLVVSSDKNIETLIVRKKLVQICYQIAKGMQYLAELKCVHRDLAARNCLIDINFNVRVSDFGLAESVYSRNYFRQVNTNAKLPLKWMALESIKMGFYTEKSDVWSYGVTIWEVFSGGAIPYPEIHPREMLNHLEEGDRLAKPKNAACSEEMNTLMKSCWQANLDSRPVFLDIRKIIEEHLATMAEYTNLTGLLDQQDSHTPLTN